MKKIIGLLLLIGLYVAAAYYTGVQGEKNLRHQFALTEKQSEVQGIKLVLEEYERGIFSSAMRFTATYGSDTMAVPFGPIIVSSDTNIQHGPLLFKGGFGVGLFSSVSTVEITTGDQEFNDNLKSLFGDSIGEIVTQGYFNNAYTAVWSLGEINSTVDDVQFSMGDSSLTVSGSYSDLNFVGSLVVGAMEIVSAEDGSKITTSSIEGEFDIENISEFVSISNMNVVIDTMSITIPSSPGYVIDQFRIVQTQKMVNEKIDTYVRFSAEKFTGPVEVTSLYYDLTFNQLDPAAIQKWASISQSIQAAAVDPLADNKQQMAEFIELVLQEGVQFKSAMGADLMDGSVRMDLTADYKPLTDGRKIADIVAPEEYLNLVEGELVMTVSQSIVNQTPLAMMVGQYVGTYVTLEGDEYRMHGKLTAGQLSVGTVELPATMLLALMGAGAAEPEQGGEAYEQEYDAEEEMENDPADEYLDE